jgi:hypothetical protein
VNQLTPDDDNRACVAPAAGALLRQLASGKRADDHLFTTAAGKT